MTLNFSNKDMIIYLGFFLQEKTTMPPEIKTAPDRKSTSVKGKATRAVRCLMDNRCEMDNLYKYNTI